MQLPGKVNLHQDPQQVNVCEDLGYRGVDNTFGFVDLLSFEHDLVRFLCVAKVRGM